MKKEFKAQLMLKRDDQSYWTIPATPAAYAAQIAAIVETRMPLMARAWTTERLERLRRMMTKHVQNDLAIIGIMKPKIK